MNDNNEDSAKKLQEPGEVIKPVVAPEEISRLVWKQYGLKVTEWKELDSYDDRNYYVFVEDKSENSFITDVWKCGYVLKVLNSMESKRPVIIEAQHALLNHLRQRGISTPEPIKNRNGETMSLETVCADSIPNENSIYGTYIVRLLKFIPGDIVFNKPYVPGTFYNVGRFVAEMHNALKGFHHPYYDEYNTVWSLSQVDKVSDFSFVLKDADSSKVVTEVIQSFKDDVEPKYSLFSRSIIHGDINEQNLIVVELDGQDEVSTEDRVCDVAGILDFSDVTYSYTIFDIAICISYLSIECKLIDQRDVGGHILAGYLSVRDLNDTEKDVLKTCVCARLVQSLVMGAYANYMDPSNTYVLTTSKRGWPLLHKIWKEPKLSLYERWNKVIDSYKKK